MDLFNLVARITLDSSGYESQLNDAAKKTNTFGGKVKTGLKSVAGIVTAGVAAVGTAAVAIGKQSLMAYADYEQLVGGVETLFSNLDGTVSAAPKVLENAAKAYKTAGMSANEYMETVTSFSAALVTGLNNDYDAAAKIADQTIIDMSDNANKMGTSMESIQNAYQGFAKQNYTMLDNLKLGYGGTKTEMERLLSDAQKFSGIKYDINNLGDVYSAIHVIQEQFGIAGTTAKEASSTISGSINMTKSAWKNLLVGMGDDAADIDKLIDDFIDSVTKTGENILPRINKIFDGAVKLIITGSKKIIPVIINTLQQNLPQLISAGIDLIVAIITGIIQALPQLITAIPQLIVAIIGALQENWPALKEAGIQLLYMIGEGMLSALAWQLETIGKIVLAIKDYLIQKWTEIKEDTEELWKRMVNNVTDRIQKLKKKIIDTWAEIKASVINLVERIKQEVINKWENLKQSVTDKIDALKEGLIEKWEAIKNSVTNAVENVKTAVVEKWENIKQTVTDTVENIKTAVTEKWMNLRSDVERTVENLKNAILTTWDNIKSGIQRKVDDLIGPVVDKFWNFYNEVTGIIGWIQDFINNTSLDLNVNARINKRVSATYDTYDDYDLGTNQVNKTSGYEQYHGSYFKYAKAYDTPYLFRTPTMVKFGDGSGAEFVYGRDNLMRDIREATGGGANVTINVYPQKGQSEKEIAREVQKEFVRWDKQRQVAFA